MPLLNDFYVTVLECLNIFSPLLMNFECFSGPLPYFISSLVYRFFFFVSFIIFVRNKVLHIVNARKIFVIDLSIN